MTMTTLKAGDTISITGTLRYDVRHDSEYIFLTTPGGNDLHLSVKDAGDVKVLATAFKAGDRVANENNRHGTVVMIEGGHAFVKHGDGDFESYRCGELTRVDAPSPSPQVDIEDYLAAAPEQPPYTAEQVEEIEREAAASVMPDLTDAEAFEAIAGHPLPQRTDEAEDEEIQF